MKTRAKRKLEKLETTEMDALARDNKIAKKVRKYLNGMLLGEEAATLLMQLQNIISQRPTDIPMHIVDLMHGVVEYIEATKNSIQLIDSSVPLLDLLLEVAQNANPKKDIIESYNRAHFFQKNTHPISFGYAMQIINDLAAIFNSELVMKSVNKIPHLSDRALKDVTVKDMKDFKVCTGGFIKATQEALLNVQEAAKKYIDEIGIELREANKIRLA